MSPGQHTFGGGGGGGGGGGASQQSLSTGQPRRADSSSVIHSLPQQIGLSSGQHRLGRGGGGGAGQQSVSPGHRVLEACSAVKHVEPQQTGSSVEQHLSVGGGGGAGQQPGLPAGHRDRAACSSVMQVSPQQTGSSVEQHGAGVGWGCGCGSGPPPRSSQQPPKTAAQTVPACWELGRQLKPQQNWPLGQQSLRAPACRACMRGGKLHYSGISPYPQALAITSGNLGLTVSCRGPVPNTGRWPQHTNREAAPALRNDCTIARWPRSPCKCITDVPAACPMLPATGGQHEAWGMPVAGLSHLRRKHVKEIDRASRHTPQKNLTSTAPGCISQRQPHRVWPSAANKKAKLEASWVDMCTRLPMCYNTSHR